MASLTLPTDPMNFTVTGDLDILDAITASNGTGTIFVRDGGLYVEGLTDLDQTTISTADGEFNVNGANKVNFNISGGATSSVEITAEDASFFTTTAGTLSLNADATDANGHISISADGTGTDSVLVEATNATSGQVTIQSAGGDTGSDAVRILASDTTDGNILIQGSGNDAASNPAVKIDAPNATSGRILITSAGDSATSDSVAITATGTTDGNVLVQSDGAGDSLELFANNAGGKIYAHTTGTGTDSIELDTAGGVLIDATGRIYLESDDTVNGVKIATNLAGVPVTLGTSTSLTTIAGNLTVEGTFTTINTESLAIEDNCVIINSGSGEAGIDSGVVMRRYQVPNDTGAGDVVNNPNPIQESGAFQAGSATPGTLVLGLHASDTDDFYNGWWIKVTSGAGIDQVRRVSSYVGSTKTVTLYVTADNTVDFLDGLDLATAPAAADTYELYSRSYMASFYGESADRITLASLAGAPDAISEAGVSTAVVQQYQEMSSGAHYIHNQVYNNASVSASGTTLTITLVGHGEVVDNKIRFTNSADLTPALADGIYNVDSVVDADSFTITAPASTVSTTASSGTITSLTSSAIYVNEIHPFDPDYPISIPGVSLTEDIIIPKASVAEFTVTIAETYGSYIMFVSNLNDTDGAYSVFAITSAGSGGSISRIAASRGADDERIDADWDTGVKPIIKHKPAATGSPVGDYTYRVKLLPGL